ncbi:MAG: AbiJ-NTD4 domain-containing protein, partial [Kosmotogaceae bacterium]
AKTQNGVLYIKDWFFQCPWTEVYDFVEFVILYTDNDDFTKYINYILKKHLSGFRVISGEIVPISSEQEIEAIEFAQSVNKYVKHHLDVALKLLSDKESPDYRNSIKESISAVEALVKLISGDSKATLGSALRIIEKAGNVKIHDALRNGFLNLYGWTSDDEGIRHSLMDEPTLSQEDAIYMLVTCSAFINYLFEKSRKFDLKLK